MNPGYLGSVTLLVTLTSWGPFGTEDKQEGFVSDTLIRACIQGPQNYDHEHNVLACCSLPAGLVDDCPTGGFVTGCQVTD